MSQSVILQEVVQSSIFISIWFEIKNKSNQSRLPITGVGLKTGRRKTGRANCDTFLAITFLLLELFNLN